MVWKKQCSVSRAPSKSFSPFVRPARRSTAARLTLRHPEMLVAHLGNYGELVLRVLADAAAENPAFTLNVQ